MLFKTLNDGDLHELQVNSLYKHWSDTLTYWTKIGVIYYVEWSWYTKISTLLFMIPSVNLYNVPYIKSLAEEDWIVNYVNLLFCFIKSIILDIVFY